MSTAVSFSLRRCVVSCTALFLLGCASAHGRDDAIVGVWSEKTPTACQTAAQDVHAIRIGELKFSADGTFGVTWMPFESYVDYWGTYSFDPKTGALALTVSGGNSIPEDARLTGTARLAPDGTLEISKMFFGTPRAQPVHTSDCPMVFHK